MKLKMRSVFVALLAVASVAAAGLAGINKLNIPVASATIPNTCSSVTVGFIRNQLPLNTYPTFTIEGPNGLTIPSSRFYPGTQPAGTLQVYETVYTASAGVALSPGNYRINVNPTAGTSHLVSINGSTGLSNYSLTCPDMGSLLFLFAYEASVSPPSGTGPFLRMNPAPQTVQTGDAVFFGAEYSTDGQNWTNISLSTIFSSPQDTRVPGSSGLIYTAGTAHSFASGYMEVEGKVPGVAQIIATYGGLTASANLTVTPGPVQPPQGGTPPPGALCGGIEVKSNLPTTWTITGPGGVSVVNPNGPAPSMGFSTNLSSTGTRFPQGEYTIRVQETVSGGRDPRFAWNIGSDSGMNAGTATFTCRGTWSHLVVTYRGVTEAGGILQYESTPLDFGNVYSDGGITDQYIYQGAFVGNHFVFRGTSCMIDMHSGNNGGGLWSISEDGTRVQEREMCIDAGAASNNLFYHAHNGGKMYVDEGSEFLFTNDGAGASLGAGITGPGPRKAVYYGFSGDQVTMRSVSGIPGSGTALFIGANEQGTPSVSGGYAVSSMSGSVVKLSDWSEVGSSPVKSFVSLGGYLVENRSTSNSPLRVYKMESGQVSEVGVLPGNIRAPFGIGYAYDFSKSPVQLVVRDFGIQQGSNTPVTPPRLIWYKVGGTGLELVKEMTMSADFTGSVNTGGSSFAVSGDYLIWPSISNRGVIVGKASGSTFTKVQTVVLPTGNAPTVILASQNGRIAVASNGNGQSGVSVPSAHNPAGGRTRVDIYKIGGAVVIPPPPGPSPSSTPSEIPGQTLNIIHATTSDATIEPAILIRLAKVLSSSATSLNISIFGRNYNVDPSRARILNMNWLPISLASILPGSYVNVWGSLDLADSAIIHAVTIRSPLPAGAQNTGTTQSIPFSLPASNLTAPAPTFSFPVAPVSPAAAAATQTQLNTLQQALRALQLRLAQ